MAVPPSTLLLNWTSVCSDLEKGHSIELLERLASCLSLHYDLEQGQSTSSESRPLTICTEILL